MRQVGVEGCLSVRAISGSHVVVLAWNVEAASWDRFGEGLLGFAIERTEYHGDTVVERYWLRGMKRFEDKDAGAPVGSPFPLSEHPVQSFQWGDYTAKPDTTYEYRIVPARGESKNLELADTQAVTVRITTEKEDDGKHGIWFNRGVAGSQAFSRKFGASRVKQHENDPDAEAMKWLSRGLFEALVAFFEQAADDTYAIRGAIYEFHYGPVLDGLLPRQPLAHQVRPSRRCRTHVADVPLHDAIAAVEATLARHRREPGRADRWILLQRFAQKAVVRRELAHPRRPLRTADHGLLHHAVDHIVMYPDQARSRAGRELLGVRQPQDLQLHFARDRHGITPSRQSWRRSAKLPRLEIRRGRRLPPRSATSTSKCTFLTPKPSASSS
jgi:hypothetical protein